MLNRGSSLRPKAPRSGARLLAILFAAWCFAAPAPAHAGDVAKARKVFADGVRLYQNGDYEGARRLFREADAEHHAPAIVYNIALAEEKLGHPQAAVDAYEAYLAEAGDKGDLAPSAAAAIAQIKARSTRLRLETKPSGARMFVEGAPLNEAAPTNVLVTAGHHVVVAQGEGWRGERDIEARGGGDVLAIAIEREEATEAAPPISPATQPQPTTPPLDQGPVTPPTPIAPTPGSPNEPEGITWGAEFVIAPAYLLGVTNAAADNARNAFSIAAGPLFEVGYALTDRFELLARGFVGIGPDAKPAYAYMGGPGLSFRATSFLWLGATFIGGRFDTRAHDARYDTDIVFGAMAEANVILLKKPAGEWLAGFQPAMLLTAMQRDNTAIFFPLTFGFRGF